MVKSVEDVVRNTERERNALDVEVKVTGNFIMMPRRKEAKLTTDFLCEDCDTYTIHKIERRETCDKGVGIVAICEKCGKVTVLGKVTRNEIERETKSYK